MSKAMGTDIEQVRAIIEEIRYTNAFYQELQKGSYLSRDELDLARLKMQFSSLTLSKMKT